MLFAVAGPHPVALRCLVPHSIGNGCTQTDLRAEAVLVHHLFEVTLDLVLCGMGSRPVVRFERVRIQRGRNVALGAWITVMPPGAPKSAGLLKNGEGSYPTLYQIDRNRQSAESCTHDRNPGRRRPVESRVPAGFSTQRRCHFGWPPGMTFARPAKGSTSWSSVRRA